MKKGNYLVDIIRSPKTILTINDIVLIWKDTNSKAIKSRLSYYVKNNDLFRVRRGIYSKNKLYDKFELASRIFTPSYISFETVLAKEGVIFQFQTDIKLASYLGREVEIDGQKYVYQKMKDTIMANSSGVNNTNEISIASKERAFLDTLYTNDDYHFDNLRSINWEKVMDILPIYNNKRMEAIVNKLYGDSKI